MLQSTSFKIFFLRLVPIVFIICLLTAGLWVPKGLFTFVPNCWFLAWFHLPCPGCGLTRSFLSLSKGEFLEAFKFNAAGPLLYAIFGFVAYEQLRKLVQPTYKSKTASVVGTQISTIFVLILFGQWVIKLLHHFGLV